MSKTFIKKPENFVCEHCGQAVEGQGYTNHCPRCLWSKHVDNFPGDRANPCGGLMAPTGYEVGQGEYRLVHCCQACGAKKKNCLSREDDLALLAEL